MPVRLTQRGAERRLAQEMMAGRITAQQFKAGVGALSKATIGAGQKTVTAAEMGLGGAPQQPVAEKKGFRGKLPGHRTEPIRRPKRRPSAPAGFFGSTRQQPTRRVRRTRPMQPMLPIAVPSIARSAGGMPTGSVHQRLADMRRRLSQGL